MDGQYVGIDFHRRRSVIVRLDEAGEKLSVVRLANDPVVIAAAVAEAGPDAEVVLEATYGWYWVVDLLQAAGHRVHLADPQGLNSGQRRVKNDERDAVDLADMLRLGRLPEGWIAPPAVRQLRELVRYRAKLVELRSGLKAQVHAVMAKEGVLPRVGDMFCGAGNAQLDTMVMADSYTIRVESLRDLIEVYDHEVVMLERKIHAQLAHHPGYRAIQAINGVGRTIAAVLVAEIGDVGRFRSAEALCSLGRVDAPPSRVGHQDHPGPDHQARLQARPLGAHQGRGPLPRRSPPGRRLPSHCRAPGHQQSPRRDRAQGPHARLLRPARRRDPLPRRSGVRLGHDRARARDRQDPRTRRRGRRTA